MTLGMWRPTNTAITPSTGAQSRGDCSPALSPDSTSVRCEDDAADAVAAPELPTSSRTMAVGTTKLMANATSPTVPALVSPSKGCSTAMPKTGVADVASIRAQMIAAGPRKGLTVPHKSHPTQKRPNCAGSKPHHKQPCAARPRLPTSHLAPAKAAAQGQ